MGAASIGLRSIARPVVGSRVLRDAALLLSLVGVSLLLRTGVMDAGYWTDESIAVGIASHPLAEIPATLRLDGSPPLYYLLLHGWLALTGTSEPATRALSLLIALAAVPAAWWAGRAVAGRRAGVLAAAATAGAPFLTEYAQETRMYSLVALLSLLVSAAFVLVVLDGRRAHLVTLGATLTALLYTHNWGLFLAAALAGAWTLLACLGRSRVRARDGVLLAAAVALAYAPWVPSLLFQAVHTGAPWAQRPSVLRLVLAPGLLLGAVGAPVLGVAVAAALRGANPQRERAVVLLGVAGATVVVAWAASHLQPAWALRYLAVALGPLLLGGAAALATGGRGTAIAVTVVAASWLLWQPPPVKSNVRTVAQRVAPALRPGDAVLAVAPEVVPNLAYYLPPGLRYSTPAGRVTDTGVTDWRNLVTRIRRTPPQRVLATALAGLRRGDHLVLVTPIVHPPFSPAPLARAERVRSRELRALVEADARLVPVADAPASVWPRRRSQVRAEVFAVR